MREPGHPSLCPGCFGWEDLAAKTEAAFRAQREGVAVADKKFQNEDPSVLMSYRVTVQVRDDSVSIQVQADAGVLYPSTKRESKRAKLAPSGGVAQPLSKSLLWAEQTLPGVLDGLEEPEETW